MAKSDKKAPVAQTPAMAEREALAAAITATVEEFAPVAAEKTGDVKRVPVIACETFPAGDMVNSSLAFAFSDGGKFAIRLGDLAPAIIELCALHGLKQKLVDAAAISRNPDTGRSATVADKKAAVLEVRDRILSGSWNKTREGGGGAPSGGMFFRAVCRLYPNRSPEFLRDFLAKKTEDELKVMKKSSRVLETIAAIHAEEEKAAGAAPVDPFAGLGD